MIALLITGSSLNHRVLSISEMTSTSGTGCPQSKLPPAAAAESAARVWSPGQASAAPNKPAARSPMLDAAGGATGGAGQRRRRSAGVVYVDATRPEVLSPTTTRRRGAGQVKQIGRAHV